MTHSVPPARMLPRLDRAAAMAAAASLAIAAGASRRPLGAQSPERFSTAPDTSTAKPAAPPAGATALPAARQPWPRRDAQAPALTGDTGTVRGVGDSPHDGASATLRAFRVFALGTLATAPFDRRVTTWARHAALHRSGGLPPAMNGFRLLGDPGAIVLTGGAYLVGRLARRPGLADAGLHAGEAVALGGLVSGAVKLGVGRARPYAVQDRDADEFRFGRGTGAFTSFPSGHTTVGFAAASATAFELTRPEVAARHPTTARVGPPLLYGAAVLVGASRVYHDKHWASDVVAASIVGTVTGRAVARFQHGRAPGRWERWLLPAAAAPTPQGLTLVWGVAPGRSI